MAKAKVAATEPKKRTGELRKDPPVASCCKGRTKSNPKEKESTAVEQLDPRFEGGLRRAAPFAHFAGTPQVGQLIQQAFRR